MRKNFGAQTWLYPMPVLIVGTYDENGSPDAMNAAWGGIHDTNQIGVCIDPGHKTAKNLLRKKRSPSVSATLPMWSSATSQDSFPETKNRTKWRNPGCIHARRNSSTPR